MQTRIEVGEGAASVQLTELVPSVVEVDGLQGEVVPAGVGSGPAHHSGAWEGGGGEGSSLWGLGDWSLTVCSQLHHRAKGVGGDDNLLAEGQGG